MKRKWIRGLAMAVALATILGAALVQPLSGRAAEDGEENPDQVLVNSLKVEYPTGGSEDTWLEDLKTAGIEVDVYKVADAQENSGYDGYYYEELAPAYEGVLDEALEADIAKPEGEGINFAHYLTEGKINMDAVDSVFWDVLAQAAAKRTIDTLKGSADSSQEELAEAYVGTITVSEPTGAGLEELESGLYLLIPHDANLKDVNQYSRLEEGRIVTLAYSKVHAYVFNPILVSLPGKEAYDYGDGNPVINTANPGEWMHDVTVALKAERLNGSLEIVKRVLNYEDSEPATFVFRVTAKIPNSNPLEEDTFVFDKVLSLTFTNPGEKTLLIENIPAGSIVTVKEEYSGGYKKKPGAVIRFEQTDADGNPVLDANGNPIPLEPDQVISDEVASVTIGAARLVVVEFENNYDFNRRGGHGITNHFSYDSVNGWVLTQFPDNAESAEGTRVPGNPQPNVTPAENE